MRRLLSAGILVMGVTLPVAAAVVPSYAIRELPAPPNIVTTYAVAINKGGVVAGSLSATETQWGVQWASAGAAPVTLQATTNPPDSFYYYMNSATAINRSGAMVGTGRKTVSGTGYDRGLIWTGPAAAPVELPTTPGDPTAIDQVHPTAINDAGMIVGFVIKYVTQGSDIRAVRWGADGTPAELTDLGTQFGKPLSSANDVNNAGVVVGESMKSNGTTPVGTRAVRWDAAGGAPTDLGVLVLPGSNPESSAYSINDVGTIVGVSRSSTSLGYTRTAGVRWDNGSTTPVQLLGLAGVSAHGTFTVEARAINAGGDIVGVSSRYRDGFDLGSHPVLWPAGSTSAIDLNSLIAPTSGWTLLTALDINDAGEILGSGIFDPDGAGPLPAVGRAFVITPTPEPSALTLLLFALATPGRRRAQQRSPHIKVKS